MAGMAQSSQRRTGGMGKPSGCTHENIDRRSRRAAQHLDQKRLLRADARTGSRRRACSANLLGILRSRSFSSANSFAGMTGGNCARRRSSRISNVGRALNVLLSDSDRFAPSARDDKTERPPLAVAAPHRHAGLRLHFAHQLARDQRFGDLNRCAAFQFFCELAAPSLRCAARESTPSWPSDKLRIFILRLITTACAATDQTPQSARRQRGQRGGHVDIPKICPRRRGA